MIIIARISILGFAVAGRQEGGSAELYSVSQKTASRQRRITQYRHKKHTMDPAPPSPAAAPQNEPLVIIIEGEIGGGKTVIARAVAEELEGRGLATCLILEPVDLWHSTGALQLFYQDPARYAGQFQSFVFATRTMAILEAFEQRRGSADVFVLERSPATDPIFMELQRGSISPIEMGMYTAWCDCWRRMLPLKLEGARVIHLKTSLDVCMARIAQRRRDGETAGATADGETADDKKSAPGVSVEYQARLRRAHEAFLQGRHAGEFPLMPISPFDRSLVLEVGPELADGNFRDEGAERTRIVSTIVDRLRLPGCATAPTARGT